MGDAFDPYYKWLAIPKKDQPPNHYRLLGVPLYIDDPDVIESAADRQMAHVRTFATGQHAERSQKLLNELSAAKLVLLNPEKRAAYDSKLKAKLADAKPKAKATVSAPKINIESTPAKTRTGGMQPTVLIAGAAAVVVLGSVILAAVLLSGPDETEVVQNDTPPETPAPETPPPTTPQKQDSEPPKKDESPKTTPPPPAVITRPAPPPTKQPDEIPPPPVTPSVPPPVENAKLVDLLDAVDVMRDSIEGDWQLEDGVLRVENELALLRIPVRPSGDYRVVFQVTRETSEPIRILLPVGQTRVFAVLGGADRPSGLSLIDGKAAGENESKNADFALEDGEVAEIALEVRQQDGQWAIELEADDESVIKWSGDAARLSISPAANEQMPEQGLLYVGGAGELSIEKLTLMMLNGGSHALVTTAPVTPTPLVTAPPREVPTTVSEEKPEERLPVPADDELAEAVKLVREVFNPSTARTREEKSALVDQLLKSAAETKNDPIGRYVMLAEARDHATSIGHFPKAFDALDMIAADYEIELLDEKEQVIRTVRLPSNLVQENRLLMETAIGLMDEAIDRDRYELASSFQRMALAIARRFNARDQLRELAERAKQIRQLETQFAGIEESLELLADDTSNPAASLAVGRFYCLVKEDWERGLVYLQQSDDPQLKPLATQDLAQPDSPEAMSKVGNAWWEMSTGAETAAKHAFMRRAGHWYQQALLSLDGLARARIERRLEEVAALAPKPGVRREVDLLAVVDPAAHAIEGTWGRTPAGLALVGPEPWSQCLIPVLPDGSYELSAQFTRVKGSYFVGIRLPIGRSSATLVMNWSDKGCGLGNIDGASVKNNPTTGPPRIITGKRHSVRVRVNVLPGDMAEVQAIFDGEPMLHWKGAQKSLSPSKGFDGGNPQLFLVGAYDNSTVFHSLQLRMLNGTARTVDPTKFGQ